MGAFLALLSGVGGGRCAATPDSVALPELDHGRLQLLVRPDSAEVYLDGVRVGLAADFVEERSALQLRPGRHVLMVRKAGYATFRGEFEAVTGRTGRLRVTLEKVAE